MPSIIYRYISLEVLKSSVSAMLVLFIILMSNTLSGVLADISLGEVPEQALIPLLLQQAVSLINLLIPFGFFLGVIFSFGRLYKDYEMPVLNSCGLGYRQMLVPVMALIIPFFIINTYFSLTLSASSQRYAQEIIYEFDIQDEFEQIKAGRFNVSGGGDHVFYMESMSEDKTLLKNVIISQSSNDGQAISIANQGVQVKDEVTGNVFLELSQGVRYEGFPGDEDFKIVAFEANGILVEIEKKVDKAVVKVKELPFSDLFSSENKEQRIELQWRLATPFSLLVLALVAVPLSYVAPRKGRYGKMGVAIVVYILYNNSLGAMLVLIQDGSIAIEIGFWLVHLFFLGLALMLVAIRNRHLPQLWAAK